MVWGEWQDTVEEEARFRRKVLAQERVDCTGKADVVILTSRIRPSWKTEVWCRRSCGR